jgi:hypothetical protein
MAFSLSGPEPPLTAQSDQPADWITIALDETGRFAWEGAVLSRTSASLTRGQHIDPHLMFEGRVAQVRNSITPRTIKNAPSPPVK